jgi:4-alpha-glucanotransferase
MWLQCFHGYFYSAVSYTIFMKFARASGVLLHPTSLPGDFGIGDLGPAAYEFVDFLFACSQTYWQVLPLGPTGYGDSPYQCFSAFAGNTLLISPEKLIEYGVLTDVDIESRPKFEKGRADYGGVYEWKNTILSTAFERFHDAGETDLRKEFENFKSENAAWLEDYSLFRAIKASQAQKPWYEWDEKLKLRDPEAIASERKKLAQEIETQKFYQFLFFKQWNELRSYASGNGIKIVGDVPIFVALDSADVWCNRDKFKLNADGTPKVVSGVPPDFFSKTGQLWGNPIYDWDRMRADGFEWWVERIKHILKMVDLVRIDHFLGFSAAWEVPGGDETAENGNWVKVPGEEVFAAFKEELGDLPFWVEDLGVVTPEAELLRDSHELPGMRILQFAFGGDAGNVHLPHNYVNNCIAYTGTHDNDTTVGWWNALKESDDENASRAINHCLKYLNSDGVDIHWDFIRAIWSSVADTAVVPMQDLLGLGNEARMNLPATTSGNWTWRYSEGAITDQLTARLKKLTELYGREPHTQE